MKYSGSIYPEIKYCFFSEFGDKNFVSVSSKGISFSLSAPKPAKPVPPTPRPSSPGPELETAAASDAGRRSGAAAFFLSEVSNFYNLKMDLKSKVFWRPN